jgi:hypothetical protein
LPVSAGILDRNHLRLRKFERANFKSQVLLVHRTSKSDGRRPRLRKALYNRPYMPLASAPHRGVFRQPFYGFESKLVSHTLLVSWSVPPVLGWNGKWIEDARLSFR